MTNIDHEEYRALDIDLKRYDPELRMVEHEPVLDYETAAQVRKKFDLSGVESKCLFVRTHNHQRWFMLVTLEKRHTNWKHVKEIVGMRISKASADELYNRTGQKPGCVHPFKLPNDVEIIIDRHILDYPCLLLSGGSATITVAIRPAALVQYLAERTPTELLFIDDLFNKNLK